MASEIEFKRWLRAMLGEEGTTLLEPARGASMGVPDLLVTVPETGGFQFPVEVKLGTLGRYSRTDGCRRLFPARIRPAQIAWHDRTIRAGGRTRLVIGFHSEAGWNVWALDDCRRETLMHWRRGFPLVHLTRVSMVGLFNTTAWWRGIART